MDAENSPKFYHSVFFDSVFAFYENKNSDSTLTKYLPDIFVKEYLGLCPNPNVLSFLRY